VAVGEEADRQAVDEPALTDNYFADLGQEGSDEK
jgi:hypothetical protein